MSVFLFFKRSKTDRPAVLPLIMTILMVWMGMIPGRAYGSDFKPLEALCEKALREGVFPGTSIAVRHGGKTVFHRAFGTIDCRTPSAPADTSTVYDLASLTKALVTTSIAMQLRERDSLQLDQPVSRYLPIFTGKGKESVTIRHLMTHTSGLRAHSFFYKSCSTPEEVIRAICSDTLITKPGTTTYSDLGFIVLGRVLETITGKSLESNFQERFAVPLGMKNSTFNPGNRFRGKIAATETDTSWHFNRPRPLVHDQNAALLGGVAGHAGLFSTTSDLLKFTAMMMDGGIYNGKRFFKPETVRYFTSRNGSYPRALGWDLRSLEGSSSAGTLFSTQSWGHLGYTGTSIWVDPQKKLAVIMLSNRVCPTSENIKIRAFRPQLHDTIVRCVSSSAP
jgi:serine-type D-Ala-D-Ala carboxypeptidase